MGQTAGRFARVEPRRRLKDLVLGLLSDLPRKNCWSIAEWAREASPDGIQHLLGRARWDTDRVRDDVRESVLGHLGDEDGVLVVDETGDEKKSTHTVGVQRQYTGTAARIENAQVAVCLVHAGSRGHAAVDRELHIPRSWTCDPDRCRAAGRGEHTVFATKPVLAACMIARFLDAGHRVGWVAGDEVYGGNPKLRSALEECGTGYVLAVACSHEVTNGAGNSARIPWPRRCRSGPRGSCRQGLGAKGHRFYCPGRGVPPLLTMARTGSDDVLFWLRMGDPDAWKVVAFRRQTPCRVSPWTVFDGCLAEFLLAVFDQRIEPFSDRSMARGPHEFTGWRAWARG